MSKLNRAIKTTLRRALRHQEGYGMRHVMNFTDVDDKIIRQAGKTGETPQGLAARRAAFRGLAAATFRLDELFGGIEQDGAYIGPADAEVTVSVFNDLQCTDCADYELEVIKKTGYAGDFLIVADFIRFAREQGIQPTCRGSAPGSIVTFRGSVDDASGIRSVRVNGGDATLRDDGSFTADVPTVFGINFVDVAAVDSGGAGSEGVVMAGGRGIHDSCDCGGSVAGVAASGSDGVSESLAVSAD